MSVNPFTISGMTQTALATVYVTMPGNFFQVPSDNPTNVDPVPGFIFLQGGTTTFGTDKFGNVVATNKNSDGSDPK